MICPLPSIGFRLSAVGDPPAGAHLFFAPPMLQSAVKDEARSWVGTPFKKNIALKGVGADCAHFVAAIMRHFGVIDSFAPPRYALDEGRHTLESKAVAYIRNTGRFQEFELAVVHQPLPYTHSPFLPGDILGFDCGKTVHHLGVISSAGFRQSSIQFVHSMVRYGVRESLLADPIYARGLRRVFRPLYFGCRLSATRPASGGVGDCTGGGQ